MASKAIQRKRRHKKVRAKIKGTARRPRFSVFKSNIHIYAQLIDDESAKTLAASSSGALLKESEKKTMREKAERVGKDIASKAKEQKISEVVFDRGGFRYAKNLKTLADTARENGMKF